jgi:membrane-anchored glycerophosphoryl diester phosphodiesterase (GDPDase)
MWSVAVPALVVEHTTIGGALARSRQLTRGHRWAIFGLVLAFFILGLIIGAIAGVVGVLVSPPSTGALASGGSLGRIAITTIAQMLAAVLNAASIASIYYELRVIKEGIGPEALASVFD